MVFDINKNTKLQKKRNYNNFYHEKPKLKFGDAGIFTKNEGRLELINISMFKKKLKLFIKKKKSDSDITREKIWYFGRVNFFIQKKPKNSRMGKGKGLIERKILRLKKNFIIFEFKGISLNKLQNFIKYFNKIINTKFFLICKKKKNFMLWSKNNKYLNYYHKYLII